MLKTISKTIAIDLYVSKRKTLKEIAAYFGCQSEAIRERFIKWNVPRRSRGSQRSDEITKDVLLKEYVENKKTIEQLANELHASIGTVVDRMKKFGIPTRNRGWEKGTKFTKSHKINIGIAARKRGLFGEKASNWKGGISFDKTAIRRNFRYQSFRRSVLNARGGNCEKCGKNLREGCPTCGHIPDRHVHHIKPFSRYVEERFSETNVLVLCDSCHKSQHFEKQLIS